jgi:hypothetical protein
MITRAGIILLLLLGATACAVFPSPTRAPGASLEVEITAWTGEIRGVLVDTDGCLKVIDQLDQSAFTLAWPPDVSAAVTNDTVTVTFGLVRLPWGRS